MTQWAPLIAPIITAIAGLITSIAGIGTFIFIVRNGSQRERQGAADRVAEKLLNPSLPDQAAIQAVVEDYIKHHQETPESHHEEGNR